MNGVGRITENKWMRRLRSDLRIVLDLILRSDLRFGPAQNKHLVVRTDGHWPFRASGLLEPLARLAKEGEQICRASGPAVNVEACTFIANGNRNVCKIHECFYSSERNKSRMQKRFDLAKKTIFHTQKTQKLFFTYNSG